jgi:SAM-dependent methyltransferase
VIAAVRGMVRRALPAPMRRWMVRSATRATRIPPVGAVRFGSLRRLTPVSSDWGFDRGLPVDRHYIEAFLERHRDRIRGRVLEIDTNEMTLRFGGERVTRSDVLHVAERRPGVTLVGDLSEAPHLPSDAFDCIVLTQTLQFIYDVEAAVRTVHRMLRPGGTVLVTVPGMSPMSQDPDGRWAYYWGFTSLSARRLFEEVFAPPPSSGGGPGPAERGEVEVEACGNVLAATAFLQGLAAEELTPGELAHRDPAYDLLVTVRATRGGGASR